MSEPQPTTEAACGRSDSTEVLESVIAEWAYDNGVSLVNRSYGKQTTHPVSEAALINLARSVETAERQRMRSNV